MKKIISSHFKVSKFYYESNQQDATIQVNLLFLVSSTCFLGDVFANHQEHLTVFTVSGSIHPCSCRQFQLIQDTSRQLHG